MSDLSRRIPVVATSNSGGVRMGDRKFGNPASEKGARARP